MRKNKGITLIALIITIIVMLILVGVVVTVVIQSDLLGTARNAGEEYKLAYEKESNMSEVTINGEKYTSLEEYIEASQEYKGLTITADTPNVEFTKADGTTPGDINNLEMGDIVKYGDYEYHYNQKYYTHPFGNGWSDDETIDGWGAKAIDREKEKYGELCGLIYGKNLKNVDFLFGSASIADANELISEAPEIPYGVISMADTFQKCSNLKKGTKIPSTVKHINYCFSDCVSLEGTIIIDAEPEDLEDYDMCFNSAGTRGSGIIVKGKSSMLDEIIATGGEKVTKGE